jgi:hypothetical protein
MIATIEADGAVPDRVQTMRRAPDTDLDPVLAGELFSPDTKD